MHTDLNVKGINYSISKYLFFKYKYLIYLMLGIICFCEFAIDELGVSSIIVYGLDVINFFILMYLIKNISKLKNYISKYFSFIWPIVSFSLIAIFSGIINLTSLPLFLYGIRSLLRFYIFIFGAIFLIDYNDIKRIFNFFFYIQIMSFFLVLYQKFILNFENADFIGGIFGHGAGFILNVFQIMIYTYFLLNYLMYKKNFSKFIIVCISSLVIASLAEEKVFYLYFIVSTIFCILFTRKSCRTIIVIIGSLLVLVVALFILYSFYPSHFEVLLNFSNSTEYLENSYGIDRLNPYSYINKYLFIDDSKKYIFGFGLGNCSASETGIFASLFYLTHLDLNYQFFTHSFIILETGYLGYFSYIAIFIANILFCIKNGRKNKFLSLMSILLSIIALISFMASSSLIHNYSYLFYFGIYLFAIGTTKKIVAN